MGFEMRLLIAQHDLLDQQIASADTRVASLLDGEVSQRLLSIPGVGPSTAATLMAEIGDIWRFTDVDQLLAYAGVHPKEQSSGTKGANRRRAGPWPRPATRICVRPRTGWPWSACSTTRSPVPTTLANALPASQR
jgi:hypothetical protein